MTPRGVDAGSDAACEQGDPDQERYGTDCLCCHRWEFGVAGSVALEGRPVERIEATDEDGFTVSMAPNPFSNFFRHYPVRGSLDVRVYGPDGGVARMPTRAPDGACNRCHRRGGPAERVHGP
jgi:hypothetical protein